MYLKIVMIKRKGISNFYNYFFIINCSLSRFKRLSVFGICCLEIC